MFAGETGKMDTFISSPQFSFM